MFFFGIELSFVDFRSFGFLVGRYSVLYVVLVEKFVEVYGRYFGEDSYVKSSLGWCEQWNVYIMNVFELDGVFVEIFDYLCSSDVIFGDVRNEQLGMYFGVFMFGEFKYFVYNDVKFESVGGCLCVRWFQC